MFEPTLWASGHGVERSKMNDNILRFSCILTRTKSSILPRRGAEVHWDPDLRGTGGAAFNQSTLQSRPFFI